MTMNALISLVVLGLIIWLIFFILGKLPIPEPARTVLWVAAGVILLVYLLSFLMGFVTWPMVVTVK